MSRRDKDLYAVMWLLIALGLILFMLVFTVRDMSQCEKRGGSYVMRAQVCLARGAVLEGP